VATATAGSGPATEGCGAGGVAFAEGASAFAVTACAVGAVGSEAPTVEAADAAEPVKRWPADADADAAAADAVVVAIEGDEGAAAGSDEVTEDDKLGGTAGMSAADRLEDDACSLAAAVEAAPAPAVVTGLAWPR